MDTCQEVYELSKKLREMSMAARHSAKEQIDAFDAGREWGRAIGLVDAASVAMDLALELQRKSEAVVPPEAPKKSFLSRMFGWL